MMRIRRRRVNSKAERNAYIDEIPVDIQTSDLLHVYRVLDRASPVIYWFLLYRKNKDFIHQLLCCFEELEKDKGDPDIDKFHILFHIFRHILMQFSGSAGDIAPR